MVVEPVASGCSLLKISPYPRVTFCREKRYPVHIISCIFHAVWSIFIDPQDYDFSTLVAKISLGEEDLRGLTDAEKDPHVLEKADRWI